MQKSIEIRQVTKVYGPQRAVDDVTLDIHRGEVVGLLGPNGAGKSTLMKIITCFIPPDKGDVKVLGRSIFGDTLAIRKQIGYLPENNPLYLEMYVREYLGFLAGIHKLEKREKKVEEMIRLTGLEKEQHKRIGALSKGYRQRVGLAQALIHDPDVLILDEPTSGLDPNQLVEIRNLIRRIGESRTVVLSTHIMQEVEAVCNRVVIIDKGKIVADEDTAHLSSMIGGQTVLELELSGRVQTELIMQIEGVSEVRNMGPNIFHINVDAGKDVRGDLFNLAVAENVKVLSLKKLETKLEDVFQALTQKA